MESTIYSNLGSGVNKTHSVVDDFNDDVSLQELLNHNSEYGLNTVNELTLTNAYVNDLKILLEQTSTQQIIRLIFSIENNLMSIKNNFEISFNMPALEQCYNKLSPLFLRTMFDAYELEKAPEVLMNEWLEVFRIAIEEEYYIWQEKIFDLVEKK